MSSRRRIFDFLTSRDARRGCPFCGQEKWNGWDERVVLPADGDPNSRQPLEAIPLVCGNCGFIRLQSAHVLRDPRGGTEAG